MKAMRELLRAVQSKAGSRPPPRPTICRKCGQEFPAKAGILAGWVFPNVCTPCGRQLEAETIAKYQTAAREHADFMPYEFRDTRNRELPPACWRASLSWASRPIHAQGLGFLGPAHLGKSRAMWFLVAELRQAGKSVLAFTPEEFEYGLAAETIVPLDLVKAPFLFIDDMGLSMGPRAEKTLYFVIQQRVRRGSPVLWTADGSLDGHRDTARMRHAIQDKLKESSRLVTVRPAANAPAA